jgi:hypothetical protein
MDSKRRAWIASVVIGVAAVALLTAPVALAGKAPSFASTPSTRPSSTT